MNVMRNFEAQNDEISEIFKNNKRYKLRQDLTIFVYSNYSTASTCLFAIVAIFILLLALLLCLPMK